MKTSGNFVKLAVVVQAFLAIRSDFDAGPFAWPEWLARAYTLDRNAPGAVWLDPEDGRLRIHTLEGTHICEWGDWIIRGVKGELYPCKPDIFAATYRPEEDASSESTIADGQSALSVVEMFKAQLDKIPRDSGAVLKMGYGFHYHLAGALAFVCVSAKALEMQEEYLRAMGGISGAELLRRYTQMINDPHPDNTAVNKMAAAMKDKLAQAREKGRGGWQDRQACSREDLIAMLIEHLRKGDPVDVANFCCFLFNRGESVSVPPSFDFDFVGHLERQRRFSLSAFGPGERTEAVLDHIRKELDEVRAKPGDVYEWIDVVILGLDGAWRAGYSPDQIVDALVIKQTRNENRTWPDWRTADPTKAIEHDRTGE